MILAFVPCLYFSNYLCPVSVLWPTAKTALDQSIINCMFGAFLTETITDFKYPSGMFRKILSWVIIFFGLPYVYLFLVRDKVAEIKTKEFNGSRAMNMKKVMMSDSYVKCNQGHTLVLLT